MKDLWEELGDSVPEYFDELIQKYHLDAIKINKLTTALVSDTYAITIGIDRFYVDLNYITRNENNVLTKYNCNNFFAEKFDDKDRENLISGTGPKESIINNFIVIRQGLLSKWSNVLEGDKKWLEQFKISKWYEVSKVREDELLLHEKIK